MLSINGTPTTKMSKTSFAKLVSCCETVMELMVSSLGTQRMLSHKNIVDLKEFGAKHIKSKDLHTRLEYICAHTLNWNFSQFSQSILLNRR